MCQKRRYAISYKIRLKIKLEVSPNLTKLTKLLSNIVHFLKPGEPEWCDAVDCSNHEAVKHCPVACSEPEWCRFSDCSASRSKETCKVSCENENTATTITDQEITSSEQPKITPIGNN